MCSNTAKGVKKMTELTDYLRGVQGKYDYPANQPPRVAVHIAYLPKGVDYPEGPSSGGWYVMTSDGAYHSDPIPCGDFDEACQVAKSELVDSQAQIEEWAKGLSDDIEPFYWD